jgi:hypothetical protein
MGKYLSARILFKGIYWLRHIIDYNTQNKPARTAGYREQGSKKSSHASSQTFIQYAVSSIRGAAQKSRLENTKGNMSGIVMIHEMFRVR